MLFHWWWHQRFARFHRQNQSHKSNHFMVAIEHGTHANPIQKCIQIVHLRCYTMSTFCCVFVVYTFRSDINKQIKSVTQLPYQKVDSSMGTIFIFLKHICKNGLIKTLDLSIMRLIWMDGWHLEYCLPVHFLYLVQNSNGDGNDRVSWHWVHHCWLWSDALRDYTESKANNMCINVFGTCVRVCSCTSP